MVSPSGLAESIMHTHIGESIMTLADKLQSIAQGDFYSEQALYDAMRHPVATCNDKMMLRRYLFGSNCSKDRFDLQQLAIYIGAADKLK